ncbi:MAG TPA: threonine/serine dehydratase [Thermomicrobiales bacterium]|nr:threonine/serine dehydratase [Thermomicrobiales bacterium]
MPASNTSRGDGATGTTNREDAGIIRNEPSQQIDIEAAAEHLGMPDLADEAALATASWDDVTLEHVLAARERIMPHLHRTPMLENATLSRLTGTDLGLKAELFQRTGSFKSRGALNAAMLLTPEQRARGVVTLSAGNHGQGLAFAASKVGTRAVVFMPEGAVPTKVEAIRGYGAETHFSPTMEAIFPLMEAYQREHGLTFISPFSDPGIIAGQGVVGLEILEVAPDVETIVVPVGGGGLLSGIALAVKSQRPDVRIIGVEPEGADVVRRSLESGKPETAVSINTIADGLTAPFAGDLSQAVIQHYVDDVVLVSDDEIINAMRLILERVKVLVEPAGAASVAALLTGKAGARHGSRTVAILSGGNVDRAKLKSLL